MRCSPVAKGTPMAEFDIECRMCGEHFVAKGKSARFCVECNKQRKREKSKEWKQTYRERIKGYVPAKKPERKGFVPAKCPDDCLYLQMVETKRCMCGFFLIIGELRGCDPGFGCKRYVGLNADEKAARHRKVKWDVVTGKKLWEAGWKDSMIAKVMRVKPDTIKAYRLRVWEAEKHD